MTCLKRKILSFLFKKEKIVIEVCSLLEKALSLSLSEKPSSSDLLLGFLSVVFCKPSYSKLEFVRQNDKNIFRSKKEDKVII